MKDDATATVAAKMRLDRAAREGFGLTWDKARASVHTGKISVDGVIVTDVERFVKPGAVLLFQPSAPRPHVRERATLERDAILHLDHAVVVVNKPAGISTVPFGDDPEEAKHTLDTIVREILARKLEASGKGRGRAPLGVVHRIDKDTSGVLVFTRTLEAKKELGNQFRHHTTDRLYLAIVHGVMTGTRTIKSYLREDRGDGLRGSAKPGQRDGQLAITHVEALKALDGATLVSCRLETGRTHQIRIHLSEAGHPLVGESVYIRNYREERIPAPRMMLHAAELAFDHPISGERMSFSAPPPPDFVEVNARLAKHSRAQSAPIDAEAAASTRAERTSPRTGEPPQRSASGAERPRRGGAGRAPAARSRSDEAPPTQRSGAPRSAGRRPR